MNARSQYFDLTMEGRQVDEAVASIFHTVLFHRCLGKYMYTGDAQYSIGTVGYTDVDCDFIDFTYVCCTSDSLQRTVKRAINVFSEKLRSNEGCGSGQISLEFFQKKKSRWPFTAECIPWEVWTIHLDLIKHENEDERQMCRENVADLLTDKVIYITEIMNRHDYVPKTPSQSELDLIFDTTYPDVQPYLFKFVSSTSNSAAPSMGNAMKKIIKETLALWRAANPFFVTPAKNYLYYNDDDDNNRTPSIQDIGECLRDRKICINKSQVLYKLYKTEQVCNTDISKYKDAEMPEEDGDGDYGVDDDDDGFYDGPDIIWDVVQPKKPPQLEKKQMIVYYNPTTLSKTPFSCFLHALARDFMFICFCRHHHQRRLGTF